jgi:glycosyltransferase involved in cell wall biosynthesis
VTGDNKTAILVYNRYLYRGGEDEVFESEIDLLEHHGWNVVPVTTSPSSTQRWTYPFRAGTKVIWSKQWHRRFRELVATVRPRVVHVHNTFPTMSPSILSAARQAGAAVVHTLHNYRLVCPNALCFRDGHPCEDCVGRKVPWPGVLHACYRGSRAQSAGVATMLTVNRVLKTWERDVDVFVGLTEFQRSLLIKGGIPGDKIVVKPNFVSPDPGERVGAGRFHLFVGKLAVHKGFPTILEAWGNLDDVPLKIIGESAAPQTDGTLFGTPSRVEFLGALPRDEVMGMMREARMVVLPSQWYESASMVAIEAFACGVPVLASRIGAVAEIVEDGRTGVHFRPGDPDDLAQKARWAWTHPEETTRMGREARKQYEERFTARRNYEMLMDVYERAMAVRFGT